ncbi:MAG: integrase [Cognaticolwellia sp.]
MRTRRRQGLADRSIYLELSILRIAVRWAEQEKLLDLVTPLRLPKLRIDPKQFKANHNTPTPAEAGLVIAAMPRDDWRLAVSVLARTGARVGEVVSLRARDLDERRGTLLLGGVEGASKTGSRLFPLDEHSARALQGLLRCPRPAQACQDHDVE